MRDHTDVEKRRITVRLHKPVHNHLRVQMVLKKIFFYQCLIGKLDRPQEELVKVATS